MSANKPKPYKMTMTFNRRRLLKAILAGGLEVTATVTSDDYKASIAWEHTHEGLYIDL